MLRGTQDNWEKLVGAVLEREELRRVAFCESLSSSFSDNSSSRFSFDSVIDQFNWSKQIRKSDELILDGGSSTSKFSGPYQEVVAAKKVVVKVDIQDDKMKYKVMKVVSSIKGIESMAIDMKHKKLTIVGEVDAIKIVERLRKLCHAELLRVGPAKEP